MRDNDIENGRRDFPVALIFILKWFKGIMTHLRMFIGSMELTNIL